MDLQSKGFEPGDEVVITLYNRDQCCASASIELSMECKIDISSIKARQEELEGLFMYILYIMGGACISITILGYIDARFLRLNDFFRMGSIIAATIQILDMISDSFFAMDIYLQDKIAPGEEYDIIFFISVVFIALP